MSPPRGPQPAAGRPDPEREPVLYVVATAHLDTQWRWTVRDTIRDFLPATLRENFALFEAHPGYVLSFEGAFRYRLMKEYYPHDFERLKRYAAAGRWHPAGAMLEAPDVNLASPEALIRQILYGNRFFDSELGVRSADIFLPDCFGFGWALPSIAAHCGLAGFSGQKFRKWGGETPFAIGLWRGPDGRGVVAALRPEGYGEGLDEDLSQAERWRRWIAEQDQRSGLQLGYKYVGIGDRGGGLPPEAVAWIGRSVDGSGPIRVAHGPSDRLFRDLTPEQIERLQTWDGELLLPTHGTGCLTSQAAMKRWNRKNELLADAAERAAAAAAILGGAPYPHGALTDAWERFLWHQMHDDLTGTSIPAAYEISGNDEVVAANRFATVLTDAVSVVARGLDTRGEGVPLVVFNPLSIARVDPVEVSVDLEGPTLRVIGPDGEGVPTQEVRQQVGQEVAGGGRRRRLVFLARVPPVGFAVYRVVAAESPQAANPELTVDASGLESPRYRLALDAGGDVASLYDKRLGRELLAAPLKLALLADHSPRWPAWEVQWRDISSPPRAEVGGPAEVRILERGPARVALEVTRRHRRSTYTQRWRLAGGEAGDRVECELEIDWHQRGRLLKAVFPLAASHPRATFDLGLGAIERGNARPGRYEVPAQQWADLTDGSGEFGVSVLSDSRYGWDKPDDRTLRLSLLRSPRTWRKFRHQATQDHGRHRTVVALAGHKGPWQESDTVWQAARLNQPLAAFAVEPGPGALGPAFSLLSVSEPAVAVRAFKRAEDGEGWILRLQELRGLDAEVAVTCAAPVTSVTEVDGMEEPIERQRLGGSLRFALGHFQPRSLRLGVEPPIHRLEPAHSRPLPLPDLAAAASRQGRPVSFDAAGRSFPAELMPDRLEIGGVDLELAAGGAACPCAGQPIRLPPGDWERLWLVACAVGGDRTARFEIDGAGFELTVGDWREPLHRSPRRQRAGIVPARLKRHAVAFYAGHGHDAKGADEPYEFCYLFRYSLPLPPGARELRLPREPRIRVFAMAVARGGPGAAEPAGPLYQ
jgi:alpha-mannosidase